MRLLLALCLLPLALSAQPEIEKDLQTRLILAEDGDTIDLPAGKILLTNTLWLDDKRNITLRGRGQDTTILSFKNQKQGAEGLKITNCRNIQVQDFTLEDSKGDLLKAQSVYGLTLTHLTARWNGKPKKTNGAYALYPVQCRKVRIEHCTAIGASDAGIYVGQSDSVVVNHCRAKWNVAGIEIENTTNAIVYKNETFDNTGGILIFDLPDLPKKHGGHISVFDNLVARNNHRNFAPKGNIVGKIPPGTGIMVLSCRYVSVYHNKIWDNRTASAAIVSYFITETPLRDSLYNPYPGGVEFYENIFSTGKRMPTWKNKLGFLFWLKFGRNVPHILWDGIQNPAWTDENGQLLPKYRICVQDNDNGSFANLHADKKFKHISRDTRPHNCNLHNPILPAADR